MRLDTLYRDPQGPGGLKGGAQWGSGASAVHFGGNFIKQKLLGTPNLVGVGHPIGPGGARRALEGQCLAIPTYFWYQNLSLNTIFNTYFESSRCP